MKIQNEKEKNHRIHTISNLNATDRNQVLITAYWILFLTEQQFKVL